jgi:nucleoporin POM152
MPGTGVAEKLFVTLMHVEDANGCIKRLPAGTIAVDIDRRLPTARLGRTERVVLKEGETTEVPLRLTGRGPWSVVYSLDGARQPPVKISQPTSELRFTAKGVYKLVSVEDENKCGGEVDAGEYIIDFKPRPGAALVESATIQRSGKAYRHTPMCAGEEDAVGVQFTGTAPFDISYLYSGAAAREHTLKSAQSVGILHLPSEAGLHRYAFRSVRDANYAKTGVDFSLHVQINARPTARISRPNRLTLCRDSPLNTDAKVRLTGAAPFSLTLGVRRPASSDVVPYTVRVNSDEWALALPQEIASEVGRYEVSVMSVSDASGCAFVFEDDAILSTSIEVVETARVVAVSHDEDMCVGDTLDFLLQGKAPWVVEYEWDGKRYTVTSSAARFSRAAESEGLFAIRSVALKDRTGAAQCKRDVAIERRVHPLPSVRIDEGVDQLREGDQPAVFAVHFRGTPPFTFSYTRSELVNGRPRVVETQTVTDIWADSYSISSSAPGDYEVTSVADKFCRYPPLGKSADA